ncbi:MAG: hypothetical protein ABIY52_18105 [Gemmatimonadaceae bacterium]
MSAAEKVFSVMLKLFPAEFRNEYGREVMLVFRDYHRDKGANVVSFWSEITWDVLKSAPALRLEVWRARRRANGSGVRMTTTMATLAIVIGAMQVVNATVEGWAGGVVSGAPESFLVGILGIVAGAMLFTAGFALLGRSTRASSLATRAALTCLGVFLFTGFVIPRMSILATLLGTVFPLGLLAFVRIASRGIENRAA